MGQSLEAPPPVVYPPKAASIIVLIMTGVTTAISAHNHHAPILAQIRAMLSASWARWLTPKRRGGLYNTWVQIHACIHYIIITAIIALCILYVRRLIASKCMITVKNKLFTPINNLAHN